MNFTEFSSVLHQNGYSEAEIQKLKELVQNHLYQEFFQNYQEPDWPEDPETFMENAFEHHKGNEFLADALNPEDKTGKAMVLKLAYDDFFIRVDDFWDLWTEERGRLLEMILILLKIPARKAA